MVMEMGMTSCVMCLEQRLGIPVNLTRFYVPTYGIVSIVSVFLSPGIIGEEEA